MKKTYIYLDRKVQLDGNTYLKAKITLINNQFNGFLCIVDSCKFNDDYFNDTHARTHTGTRTLIKSIKTYFHHVIIEIVIIP
jgi:hypothetical protein